jgi:hypothetical protein
MFCSLINKRVQVIQPSLYTELRFGADESSDADRWHQNTDLSRRESALIIPRVTEVGMLWAKISWAPFDSPDAGAVAPTKYYAKFVRDPWTSREDQTGAQHFAAVPNSQNQINSWIGVLRTGQPLALQVTHNGNRPMNVVLAEYKAWVP